MEYGVWNRDYDLQINGVDHLVAKRKLIHPRRQEREKITHKKQPSKPRALQVDSPSDKMSCTIPRNKASQDRETKKKKKLKRLRRR
jgi:hypothetical protein